VGDLYFILVEVVVIVVVVVVAAAAAVGHGSSCVTSMTVTTHLEYEQDNMKNTIFWGVTSIL